MEQNKPDALWFMDSKFGYTWIGGGVRHMRHVGASCLVLDEVVHENWTYAVGAK